VESILKALIKAAFRKATGLEVSRYDKERSERWSPFVEDYYPVNAQPRWGHGLQPHKQINELLSREIEAFKPTLIDFRKYRNYLDGIPFEQASDSAPYWNNIWFSTLDAAALSCFLLGTNPTTYLEVGSGFSTRFARKAISHGSLKTKLISIDPQPRSEINALCDHVVRSPLETVDLSSFKSLRAGDIAFFDGSHRVFTNSDTTVFFMDVLPALKSGVLVHFHDIFWPDDYTPDWNRRLYSEQYVLGAMMLGGMSKFEVVLPNYFVSTNRDTSYLVDNLGIPTRYPGTDKPGLSFWLRVR
jgi:Methyltransferase domain